MSCSTLKCNKCWKQIEEFAFVTGCAHVFCSSCSQVIEQERVCPACDHPSRDIRQVPMNVSEDDKMVLCGLPIDIVMEISSKAIQFYQYQKQNEIAFYEYVKKRTLEKAQTIEKSFTDQLTESQNKLNATNGQVKLMKDEITNLRKEVADIQDKYMQKTRQKRKLEEFYEELKNKYQDLRRTSGINSSSPAPLALKVANTPAASPNNMQPPTQRSELFVRKDAPIVTNNNTNNVSSSELTGRPMFSFNNNNEYYDNSRNERQKHNAGLAFGKNMTMNKGTAPMNRFNLGTTSSVRPSFFPPRPLTPSLDKFLNGANM